MASGVFLLCIQISDAVYSLVQEQCKAQYEAVVQKCESGHTLLEASIRTDMDQIITSKEHVTNKIRGLACFFFNACLFSNVLSSSLLCCSH